MGRLGHACSKCSGVTKDEKKNSRSLKAWNYLKGTVEIPCRCSECWDMIKFIVPDNLKEAYTYLENLTPKD